MLFSNRRCVTSFVTLSTAVFSLGACVIAGPAKAQMGAGAPPAAPTILALNDPGNPYHLTASQQLKSEQLKAKFQAQATAVMEDKSIPNDQKQGKVNALQIATIKKMQALLTPDQMAIVTKIANVRAKLRSMQMAYQAAVIKLDKSVTPDEKKQLVALQQDVTKKAEAEHASPDTPATQQQKMAVIVNDYHGRMKKILVNPGQLDMLDQLAKMQAEYVMAQQNAAKEFQRQ